MLSSSEVSTELLFFHKLKWKISRERLSRACHTQICRSNNEQVVIVTGASSGIGLASAEALLKSGAKVFGCDIGTAPTISSDDFHFLQVNLAEADAAPKIVEACVAAFGEKLDGLLNVAGIMDLNNSVDSLTDGDWDKVIAVNLTGPVKLMRSVVPIMLKGGKGSIVNVASKAGMSGAVAGVAYTSSKHGLVSLGTIP